MFSLLKPLYHPSVNQITVQGILCALSDPVRVRIFSELAKVTCSMNCSAFLNAKSGPLPKSTLSQHFKILREAGLIRSERKGVELLNFARCEDLQKRFGSMIMEILQAYAKEDKLKANEASATRKPKR